MFRVPEPALKLTATAMPTTATTATTATTPARRVRAFRRGLPWRPAEPHFPLAGPRCSGIDWRPRRRGIRPIRDERAEPD
jgi:hypothetical protein